MSGTYSVNPLRNLIAQAIGIPSPSQQEGMPASLLGQLLLAEQQATSGVADPNRTAADTLTGIAGGGTANETPYGGVGPQGAPSTENPINDARAAQQAGLGRFGLSLAANPANLVTSVPATMAAAVVRSAFGVPEPNRFQNAFGLQGLAQAIRGAYTGMPVDKPLGLLDFQVEPAIAALAAASAAAKGGTGYGGSKDDTVADVVGWGAEDKSDPSAEGGSKDGGSAGTGGGAGAPGGPSGTGDEDNSGGFGAAKQGGLATERGFLGPEYFAQGGQVIELQGGGKIAIGPGGGLDDLIPTSINGRRAAALSDGEFVIPADVVSMLGDGSSNAGSRRLYDIVRQIRQAKTGTSEQAGPLPVGEILKRAMS